MEIWAKKDTGPKLKPFRRLRPSPLDNWAQAHLKPMRTLSPQALPFHLEEGEEEED